MLVASLTINHKLAPIEVREALAFSESVIADAINKLITIDGICAGVILSTCNRLEIYISSDENDTTTIKHKLTKFLADYHQLEINFIEKYLIYFSTKDTINHICSVASGLDSMVLGEPQILGQLKTAYKTSKDNQALNSTLEKLFQHAFLVAKKIRTDTEIGKNPVSVAYCGVKLSEKIFTNLNEQTALLVGAGEMIELSSQHLKRKNIKHIIVANRTRKNAEKITSKYGGEAISLAQISKYMHKADILITSTAAPIAIIGKGLIESAMKKRKQKPMFILDIAVPRDVEVEVSQLDGVYLYTVDDLNSVIDENMDNRNQAKEIALQIIGEKTREFMDYLANIKQNDLIKSYNNNANIIKQELLENILKKIEDSATKDLVIKLADQLTSKLLHNNFINIKQGSKEQLNICQKCVPKINKTLE